MSNLRYYKKLFVFGKIFSGFSGILLVSFLLLACENLIVNDGGSLIIAVPGARAASASRYTIELTGANGTTQSKTLAGGTTAQFDDLAPDTYTIVVEGMDASGAVVFYGTDSATVEAGKTASADVELKKGASDFASLESAVAAGGTVYIFESIDVENGLTVGTTVEILPAYQDVTLTNKSSKNLFTVDTNGNLTIGGGEYTITLDGNAGSHHAIYMKNTGKATLSRNAVITNCGTAGVKLDNSNYSYIAYFYLEGGSIMGNNGSGVEINNYSQFHMNSGVIENNNATDGGGVSAKGGSLYLNGGSITGNNANGSGGGIYVSNAYLYMNGGSITDNTSTGSGGGIYSTYRIIMTGGVIEGNSTSGSGNGVYSGNSSQFSMGNSAVIDKNNDVYLMKSITISVTSELTGDFPVATITPYTYPDDTTQVQVLSLGNFTSAASKFAVTPNPAADGTQWFINTEGKLEEGACVSDFTSLENAISAGGLVYIASNIDISKTLEITTEVTLLSTTQSVVLKNTSSGNLFTVSNGGKLTIGDADHAITLDGNKKSSQIISVDDGGTVSLVNGTITNANASGVYISTGGTFNMTGGSITGNATSNGGGVYVNTGATFTMSGSAVVDEDNDVFLSEGTTISVSGDLSGGAKITPHEYNIGLSLLSIVAPDSSIHVNFTVTPGSFGQQYEILPDGTLGTVI